MIASSLLSMWLTLPIFIGAFIPLSVFLIFHTFLSSNFTLRFNLTVLLITLLFIFYILALSLFKTVHWKEVFRYIDLALIICFGQNFVKNVMLTPTFYRLAIVFMPFLAFVGLSGFNQNYPSVAIILFLVIIADDQSRTQRLLLVIMAFLGALYFKVHTALVASFVYLIRLPIMSFIVVFALSIFVLTFFIDDYPVFRALFRSAFVRVDLWFGTMVTWSAELDVVSLFFGQTTGEPYYTNGQYSYFSGFTFVGVHPHNQFIYIIFEYGVFGIVLFLLLLFAGVNEHIRRIRFLPLFVIFWFEASNDLMYYGLLGLIMVMPTIDIHNGAKIYKRHTS